MFRVCNYKINDKMPSANYILIYLYLLGHEIIRVKVKITLFLVSFWLNCD